MGFFDDMTTAIETYPETDVKIEIVDVAFTGNALNADEEATFKVKVTNTGPLRLNGVTLRVKGMNGALVKDAGALAQFVSEFVTSTLDQIGAHGGSQTTAGTYRLQAPGSAQPAKTLVKASLEAWDADIDHILESHSRPLESVNGTFDARVVAA